ncbi:MAG: MATE family efflux transporter [Clostridia bacterium]|nr:MATE family efflux transporter [Clostridia bacterium]
MSTKINCVDVPDNKLFGAIVKYSIPLMLAGFLQLLFNAADVVVVGRFAEDSEAALAAVGSTGSLINLLVNLFTGLSVGVSVTVSHYYGGGDEKNVSKTAHTSLIISVISGLALMLVGLFFSRTFLSWMDTPDSVIDLASIYMQIYFVGIPASLIYNFCSAVIRSVGDTKTPFIILSCAGVINVLLNMLLVIVFHLDVVGVATATTVANWCSAAAIVFYMAKAQGCIQLKLKWMTVNKRILKKIILIGLPAGLQGICFSISNVIIQSALNSFNDKVVLSANTAAANIEGFIYILMNACYHACVTFTGQNIGSGRKDRISKVALRCAILTVAVGMSLGFVFCLLLGKNMIGIYITDSPLAIEYGYTRLCRVGLLYFLYGLIDVIVGSVRGMGSSTSSMIVMLFGVCGIRILWISFIFKASPTLSTLYLSYPVSWLITLGIILALFFIDKKRVLNGRRPLP